jgi:hypothetical protein
MSAIPVPSQRTVDAVTRDAELAIQRYFAPHTGSAISPREWLDCLVAILCNQNPYTSERVTELEEDLARLALEKTNAVAKATSDTRQEVLAAIVTCLESFVASEASLGAEDKLDVSGVRRVLTMIKAGVF